MNMMEYKTLQLIVHMIKTIDAYQTCIKNGTLTDKMIGEMDNTLDTLLKLLPKYEQELRRYC